MGEAVDTGDAALSARFEAVAEEIRSFRPRKPHEHPNLLGGEAAIPFERIVAGLARGRGGAGPRRSRSGTGCTTPGCSRASDQNHHIVFQSHGGSDDLGNQTALCAPHHLRGIHGGRLRVSGIAPDHLVWELRSGRRLG